MKRLSFVLLIVVLFAGATTSFAQYTGGPVNFSAGVVAGMPAYNAVRIAGMAEWVYDTNLIGPAGPTVLTGVASSTATMAFQVTYSTTIANKTLAFVPAAPNCPNTFSGTLTLAPASNIGIQVSVANIACAGGASTSTTVSWTASGSTLNIVFSSVSTNAAQTPTVTLGTAVPAAPVVTIRGVRLNVAALGATPAVSTLTASYNAYPAANLAVVLPGPPATLTVATAIVAGLGSVSRLSGNTDSNFYFITIPGSKVNSAFGTCNTAMGDICGTNLSIRPKSSYGQCNIRAIPQSGAAGGSVIITGDGKIDTSGLNDFGGNGGANALGIKVTEGAPGILATKAQELARSPGATEVDNGARLRIDFTGLPSQAVVAAAEQVSASQNDNLAQPASGLTVDLVGANYCAVGSCPQYNQAIADVRAASGGALTLEYEVTGNTGSSTGNMSSVIIPFFVFRTSLPVDLSTVNISVRLGPVLGSNVVRFSDTAQSAFVATVTVTACTSRLFFPFVTNMAGWDTGIYVANAGQSDQQNTGQSGACTASFFNGSTTGTTPVKASASPTLGPGQSFSFTASDPTLGKPGFQGYVTVNCMFQYSYGLAFVITGYGSVSAGTAPSGTAYLAISPYFGTVP